MDEEILGNILADMRKKVDQLAELLEDHDEVGSETFDPRPCLSLVEALRADIEEANDQANDMSKMVFHIADKVIEARLKDSFSELRSPCYGSFEEALQIYEVEVEEMALRHANEDMKNIFNAITRT